MSGGFIFPLDGGLRAVVDCGRHLPRTCYIVSSPSRHTNVPQKNVYSVFRFNPPSVGFAALSDYSLSMNGNLKLAVPSATIGSVSAFATAGGSSNRNSSAAVSLRTPSLISMIAIISLWAVLAN